MAVEGVHTFTDGIGRLTPEHLPSAELHLRIAKKDREAIDARIKALVEMRKNVDARIRHWDVIIGILQRTIRKEGTQ